MAMTMHLDIVSAEKEIFSGRAEVVIAPAIMGEVGIHARHTPMLTPLKPGEVKITKQGGEEEYIYVSGGMMEVQPSVVTILSDTAVRAQDLDEAAAMEAKQAAEEAISNREGDMDIAEARSKLLEAVAQLRMIENFRKNR